MALRISVTAVLTALLAVGANAAATVRPNKAHLVAFRSCPDLLGYVRDQSARFVTPYGLGQQIGIAVAPRAAPNQAAPQQGVDYSGTNVQEAGVDEPDVAKTNGVTLFTAENGMLQSTAVGTGRPRLLDTLKLDNGWSHELLLSGSHLLVLTRGGYWVDPLPAQARMMIVPPQPASSTLTEVDVSDPAHLKVIQTLTLDGGYVDARMIGSAVRIVSSTALPGPLPYANASDPDALAKNQNVVASSKLSSWLPTYRLGKGAAHRYFVPVRVAFGRPRLQFHELRHACATLLLERGLTPEDVALQLGHRDGGGLVRRLYGHPSENLARERIALAFAEVPSEPVANRSQLAD